jgi:uncharacterized protein (TIGR02996 family)
MTHDEAFLQAIIENPDDDTPRLVYADWLDEHGDADRAEFIRVQCLQASLPWDDDRQSELLAREAQLLARHYEDWTAVCGDWPGQENKGSVSRFRRGFIESVWNTELSHFLEAAPALFTACPIRQLQMSLPPGKGLELAGCPYLGRLRLLRLFGRPADALQVCRSPHLGQLETLDLFGLESLDENDDGIPMGDEGIRELAAISGQGTPLPLRSLRCLGVGSNGLGDDALETLVASPLARTVTGLDLGGNDFTIEGLRLLVSSPWWRRLEELDLSHCFRNSREAGRLLAGGLGRSRLRALRMVSTLSESLVEALATAPTWGPLRALSLGHCRLDGGRLRLLLDCPHVAGLTVLRLSACGLGDAELELLAGCPRLCSLTELWVGNNLIGDRAAVALAESPYLKRLRRLDLKNTRIMEAGIAALARSANVEPLRHLSLHRVCSEAAVAEIARSPRLDHLYALHLGVRLTDDTALTLARSPFLRSLSHLRIDFVSQQLGGQLTETGRQALRQATHGVWGSRGVEERSEPFFSWEA